MRDGHLDLPEESAAIPKRKKENSAAYILQFTFYTSYCELYILKIFIFDSSYNAVYILSHDIYI